MTEVFEPDDAGVTIKVLHIGDLQLPPFRLDPRTLEIFENLADLEIKDDDVMLCTYPKTGRLFFIYTPVWYIVMPYRKVTYLEHPLAYNT